MKVEPYDFRKPGRRVGELEQRLDRWLRDFCTLAPDQWSKHLAFRAEVALQGLEPGRSDIALGQLPHPAVAYRIAVNSVDTSTLLVLPRQLSLVLLSGLLGETCTELPADRELTVIEEALAEYFLQHLLLVTLQETWRGSTPPVFTVQQPEPNPRYARLFPPASEVLVCSFVLRGPFGEQSWYWLVPPMGWLEPSSPPAPDMQKSLPATERSAMEPVIRELPVEVSVVLGTVEVPVSQVARLRVGDLLVLKQHTAEPLSTLVAGDPKFRVWPGRVGSRKAVEIESLIG